MESSASRTMRMCVCVYGGGGPSIILCDENKKGELICLIFPRRCLSRSYRNHYIWWLNGLASHYVFEAHQRRSIKHGWKGKWLDCFPPVDPSHNGDSFPKRLVSRALNRLWNHSQATSLIRQQVLGFRDWYVFFPIIENATTRFRQMQELKRKTSKCICLCLFLCFVFFVPLHNSDWQREL